MQNDGDDDDDHGDYDDNNGDGIYRTQLQEAAIRPVPVTAELSEIATGKVAGSRKMILEKEI